MTIHEIQTPLDPTEVIERARSFFVLAGTPYAAFPEQVGAGFLRLHLEVGEVVIGTVPRDGGTLVRGSASRGAHLLTQFLTTLGQPCDAKQTIHRHGLRQTRASRVQKFAVQGATPAEPVARPAVKAA